MIRSFFAFVCVLLGACAEAPVPPAQAGTHPKGPASTEESAPRVREIDAAALRQELDRGAVRLLVDVRTPEEYAAGHVPEARNLPLQELESRWSELGAAGDEVHLICQSGARSARASQLLLGKGLRPVNVRGGTSGWIAAGLPTSR